MIRIFYLVLIAFLLASCSGSSPKEENEGTYTLVEENNPPQNSALTGISYDKFDFMIGTWLDNTTMIEKTGIQYMEKWRAEPNDTYSCQSYQIEPVIDRSLPDYMRNGARVTLMKEGTTNFDTLYTEKVTLVTRNGVTYYDVTVFNQNSGKTISFALSSAGENVARFENPNHDFPQFIEYKRTHPDTLHVVIGSIDGQKKHGLTYIRVRQQ